MAGVLLRKREGDLVSQRHVQEGRVKTKAGAGGTQPQTEEHQEPPGAGRGKKDFSLGALGGHTALPKP